MLAGLPGQAAAACRGRSRSAASTLHLGWHPQGDGKWFYGLSVENGRVKDEGTFRLRSGLRTLVERFQPELRLTPLQDVLLCDLDASATGRTSRRVLAEHGIPRPGAALASFAGTAWPARRSRRAAWRSPSRSGRLPGIIDELEAELAASWAWRTRRMSVRMTGCPNGCARPYQSDIGIVGRSGDKYTLFVGGSTLGDRLNFMLRDLVPIGQIVPTLAPILKSFRDDRQAGESFGDFCHRLGLEALRALLPRGTAGRQSPLTPDGRSLEGRMMHAPLS